MLVILHDKEIGPPHLDKLIALLLHIVWRAMDQKPLAWEDGSYNYIRWDNFIPTMGPAAGTQDSKLRKKALNERLSTNNTKVTCTSV